MNKYSPVSQDRLESCHPDLQVIFETVLPIFDHSILCGFRDEEEQNSCFFAKKSKLKWPDSKHNKFPSHAVDAAPFDQYIKNVDWADKQRICYFAGFVMATANVLYQDKVITHQLRWGNDWDMDTDLKDTTFRDMVHYELVIPK